MPRILRLLHQAAAGSAIVEFAFLLPVLVALAVGAYDFGRWGYEQSRMESAARAGAQYGVQDQTAAIDISGMIAAARRDAGDTAGALDIAARQFCRCAGAGAVGCSSTCPDGFYPASYVEVTVRRTLDLFFAPTVTVAATRTMRAR